MRQFLACFLVFAAVTLAVRAQSPATRPADPGPLATDAVTGLQVPVGYRITSLFDLSPFVAAPADMVVGPNGDLFFTATSGSGCGPTATTHLYRVPMNGLAPQQPFTVLQYTTTPIAGHVLVYDSLSGNFYAAGTCDQTQFVYRIPPSGVPEVVNPGNPLPDPDSLALGSLPNGSRRLFVAAQDQLYALDVSTPIATVSLINVNLSGTGLSALGNWGYLRFDALTSSLLATLVGSPTSYLTLEIHLLTGPPVTASASVLAPVTTRPLCTDPRGARLFSRQGVVGYLNNPGLSATIATLINNITTNATVVPAGVDGGFYVLDEGNARVYRLDPTFRCDRLSFSASLGATINYYLKAPPGRGSEDYLIFACVSGATPGVMFGTVIAPLNYDLLTEVAVGLAITNSPILPNWNALLDSTGTAFAQFICPPGLALPNTTMNFCYGLGFPDFVSNATWVHVLP